MESRSHNLLLRRAFQYLGIIVIVAVLGGGYWYWKQARAAQTVTDNRPSFEAPLATSLDLVAGQGIATYSRADGADRRATVADFEGKIISVKQNEARFEGARRVENLFSYSNNFSNAAWSTQSSASKVGTNQFIIDSASASSGFYQAMAGTIPVNANRTFRYSIDVQWVSGDTSYQMGGYSNVGFSVSPTANITVSSEWKRFSTIATTGATDATNLSFNIIRGSGTGGTINVRNAQLEDVTGQTNQNPSEYVSTNVETSFPYHGAGVDGVKYFDTENGNTVASNVVTEATGTAIPSSTLHGYLAEGARTNMLTYSEQLDNAAWSKPNNTVIADATASPTGNISADRIVVSSSNATHYFLSDSNITSGLTYTQIFYAKSAGYDWVQVAASGGFDTSGSWVNYDLSTGAIGNKGGGGFTSSIVALPNGWYRISISATAITTTSSGRFAITPLDTDRASRLPSYSGDDTSGIYAWGMQLEQAAFASSYIPTTTAAVARVADSLSYPLTSNVNDSEGSIAIDVAAAWSGGIGWDAFFYDSSLAQQRFAMWHWNGSNNGLTVDRHGNGGVRNNYDTGSPSIIQGAIMKLGQRWSSSAHSLFRDGVLRGSDTSLSLPYDVISSGNLFIGRSYSGGSQQAFSGIKNVRIWKKALSDTELRNLTSTTESIVTSAVKEAGIKAPDNTGLVGYWSFEDGSGTQAEDFSLNTNTGTLTNGPTWVDGKVGKAINFDGTNDYVTFGDVLDVGTGDMSVSVWVKSVNSFNHRVVSKWIGTGSDGWIFDINETVGGGNSPGFIRFRMNDTGGHDFDYSADGNIDDGKWHLIGFSLDRDSAEGLRLFVDGVQIGASSDPTVVSGSLDNSADLALGVIPTVPGSYMAGSLDEVRIYDRALTASEIAGLYRQSESAHTTVNVSQNDRLTSGLVGLWSFDGLDLSGTTAYDRSGNGNDNTLKNGVSVYPGKVGQGLNLDGVDDYVCIDDSSTCTVRALFDNAFSARSVSLWFYPRDVTSTQVLFEEGGTSNGMNIYIRSGSVRGGVWSGFGSVYLSSAVAADAWHHAVIAFEYPGNFSLYLDGTLVDSSSAGGSMAAHTGNDALGAMMDNTQIDTGSQSGDGLYFNGRLDEFRVYDRALSQDEVTMLYNMGK